MADRPIQDDNPGMNNTTPRSEKVTASKLAVGDIIYFSCYSPEIVALRTDSAGVVKVYGVWNERHRQVSNGRGCQLFSFRPGTYNPLITRFPGARLEGSAA